MDETHQMKLVEFPEQTVVIAKNQPEYLPLPAHRFADAPEQGRIAFCWQLTWRERLAVLWRGVVWHQVLTFNHPLQPQLLATEKPVMPSASAPNVKLTNRPSK
jgi:hypothetical protein